MRIIFANDSCIATSIWSYCTHWGSTELHLKTKQSVNIEKNGEKQNDYKLTTV